jgi:group I intron endonuclease
MDSGVYKIENKTTGGFYIGSSANVLQRWRWHIHRLQCGDHHNPYLQRSWSKHGEGAFSWVVLEEIEPIREKLIDREQFYIDTLHPTYNMNAVASTMLGYVHSEGSRKNMSLAQAGRTHSDETKWKMSLAGMGRVCTEETKRRLSDANMGKHHSQETLDKISVACKGHRRSEETCNRISEAMTGKKREPFSDETRRKMSDARKVLWGREGGPYTPEYKAAMSLAQKGRPHTAEHIAASVEGKRRARIERERNKQEAEVT